MTEKVNGLVNGSKEKANGFWTKIKSKFTRRRVIILVIILLIAGYFIYRSTRPEQIEVELVEVEKGSLTESVDVAGEVNAEKYSSMTFPTSGKLAWLGVKEGDIVTKWQSLASLDKTTLWASYNTAQNNLRNTEAALDSTYDSVQGNDTTETYAQRATRTAAETAKDSAYDAVQAAQYNLSNSTLYAPFNGVITNFASGLSEGVNVSFSTPVFAVIDPETVYITTEVGEIEVIKLKVGQKVIIELDAYPGEIYTSEVESIDFASTITSTGGTAYKVKVSLPENEQAKFRVGMNGDVEIIIDEKEEVLLVPSSAVTEEDGKKYVWIVDNSMAKRVEIETDSSSIDEYEVTSGLDKGILIIERPPKDIEEGLVLTVTKSNGEDTPNGIRGIFGSGK